MLIVEVMNEARSSTVDSVHIAFSRGRKRKVPNGEMRHLRAAQNRTGNMRHIFGLSPSGKATDFVSVIRWFKSN